MASDNFPFVDFAILLAILGAVIGGTIFLVAYTRKRAKRIRKERLIAEFLALPSETVNLEGNTDTERLEHLRAVLKQKFFPRAR